MSMAVRQYEASQDLIAHYKIEIANLTNENYECKQKIEFLQTEVLRAKQYIKQRDAEIALRQRDLAVLTEKSAEKDRLRDLVNVRLQQFEEQEEPRSLYIANLLQQVQNLTERAEVLEENEKRFEDKEKNLYDYSIFIYLLFRQERIRSLEKQNFDVNQKIILKQQAYDIILGELAFIAESVPSNEYGIEIGKLYSKYVNQKLIKPSDYPKMFAQHEKQDSICLFSFIYSLN